VEAKPFQIEDEGFKPQGTLCHLQDLIDGRRGNPASFTQLSAKLNATFTTRTCGSWSAPVYSVSAARRRKRNAVWRKPMRLLGPLPPALGIPSVQGTRQMQARVARLGHTIAPPGRPKHSSPAIVAARGQSELGAAGRLVACRTGARVTTLSPQAATDPDR
jgi:hypothetical protein